jgi:hypothetical protein
MRSDDLLEDGNAEGKPKLPPLLQSEQRVLWTREDDQRVRKRFNLAGQ